MIRIVEAKILCKDDCSTWNICDKILKRKYGSILIKYRLLGGKTFKMN